jgi:hypothetical protein
MRHVFARLKARIIGCTLHDVIEGGGWGGQPRVYPYRCHRCGRCFVCQHTPGTIGNEHFWVCADGIVVAAKHCSGVPA